VSGLARGTDELPPIGLAVVTLGVFDGVHLGHQHIVAATVSAAAERGASSVAIVFEPHPLEVIEPGRHIPRLTRPSQAVRLLHEEGIERPLLVRFDHDLRRRTPEEFLDALGASLDLRALVMTPGSAFGRDRQGTLERMRELGPGRGFDVVAVDPLLDGDEPVSSTRIRRAIAAGEVAEAARLMGRASSLVGTVVHGDRRGHQLGFPTANLAFDYQPALPALGIYRGEATVPLRDVGPRHPALVSVGVRPTFHDDGRVLAEVYLLDWDGDLYDAELEVALLDRLREERRFDGVDALVTQMRADEAEARRRFASDPGASG
jgi:riboflavin kinase / FMN adenylyltransferase